MRSNSRHGSTSLRIGSSPKIRAAIRPLVDALERRLLLSGTLPSFVQASTDASYTLDNSTGSMVMDLNSGSMVVNADLSTATGWSNAAVRLHNSAQIYFNSGQTLGDLELRNFSSATVALGSTAASGNLLQLSGLSIDTWSKLDLGDNAMILHYAASQEAADNSMVFGLLANGYSSSDWNRHGIYSSAAANDPSGKTALGFADNNVLHDASFAGVSLGDDNEILIRDTLYGDSNLDGAVADSTADDPQFQEGTNGLGTGWSFGDYNYDSITAGAADASLFAANANQSISQPQYQPSLQIQPLSFMIRVRRTKGGRPR
ncbi:MAG TPA: LEPR-XLL domain-containing protein [Tepidisphaeraceae bacterium]|nr:LEPR-XLL domain-containing protein [Tepidisphaeraceae bacterium]